METQQRKYQDETGQWWHQFEPGRRVRCALLACRQCGAEFPSYRGGGFCSYACRDSAHSNARPSPETEAEIVTMYQAGASVVVCAASFHVKEGTVRSILRRFSQERHVRGFTTRRQFSEEERDAMREQFLQGLPIDGIALNLGTTGRKVSAVLTAQGYAPGKKRVRVPRTLGSHGYVWIVDPETPRKPNGRLNRVQEHRVILAGILGRPLLDHETVHHKNGDRADNRPENLELRAGRHGKGATEAHCPTCQCFQEAP